MSIANAAGRAFASRCASRPAYEDSTMHITFADEAPVYDGDDLAVHFAALIDGEPVVCSISAEALEDHFGAKSPREDDLLDAFARGSARIRAVCAEVLDDNGGQPAVLRSGLFRVAGMEPD
ncbi:periplasmic protein [Caballeronia calidae]|uniref:Periplasmic protein n=2 Tax=Caballeronia calidae TaxID=1777139 RepID=A0A157ZTR2_9BURK|nr:periplasmic protein [Caballeronia calidae]